MGMRQKLFDFYLDASVHVALAVVALVRLTELHLGLEMNGLLHLFLFLGTIASYNFIKYGVEAEKYFLVSNTYHRYIQVFSFIAIGAAIYPATSLHFESWVLLAFLAILIGLYALPILPQLKNLRNFGLVKVALVAFVWGGTTVVLPVVQAGKPLDLAVHMEALQRMLFVLILMLPFEIRDLVYDHPSLRTLPQRLGTKRTQYLGVVLCVVFYLLTWVKAGVRPECFWIEGGVALLLVFLVLRTDRASGKYFASFWVEAVPVFWFLAYWIARTY